MRAVFNNTQAVLSATAPTFDVDGKLLTWHSHRDYESDVTGFFLDEIEVYLQRNNADNPVVQNVGGFEWSIHFVPTSNTSSGRIIVNLRTFPDGAGAVVVQFKNATAPPGELVPNSVMRPITFTTADVEAFNAGSGEGHSTFSVNTNVASIKVAINIVSVSPSSDGRVLSPAMVKRMLENASGRVIKIPGAADYDTAKNIIRQSVDQWERPALQCTRDVSKLLVELLLGPGVGDRNGALIFSLIPPQFGILHHNIEAVVKDLIQRQVQYFTSHSSDYIIYLFCFSIAFGGVA